MMPPASTTRPSIRPRPVVVVAEPIDPECVAWLAQRADVRAITPGEAVFDSVLGQADALLVRTYVRVDTALLARAPRLRVVARAGVGLDNIDLTACAARGLRVVHTPGANTDAVVEFVLGVILDDLRPRSALTRALNDADWHRARADALAPRQFRDLTLGILGLGRIGSALARAAGALNVTTLYHDLLDIPPGARHAATPATFDDLFRRADILSIHVDARPSNRHLVAAPALALMKPDALLINTSRGLVLDHHAMAHHLGRHTASRAVLDVHDPEPIRPDHPLLGRPNARLTPHIASATVSAKRAMSWVVRDLWHALNHDTPAPGEHPPPAPTPSIA